MRAHLEAAAAGLDRIAATALGAASCYWAVAVLDGVAVKGKGVGDFILALCHMFLTVEWRRLKVVVSAAGQIEICDTRGTSGTESVKFMAFYDVKNARLMERRPTETVVQREAEFGWRDKAVHLNSGMANSKTYEKAILCWKGEISEWPAEGSPICGCWVAIAC